MHFSRSAYNRLRKRVAKATGRKLPAAPKAEGPNLTEQSFNRVILAGVGQFIGQDRKNSFVLTRLGSKYTPDFAYAGPDLGNGSRIALIEVKGKYRSKKDAELIERRSRLAWEIAADQHPEYDWVWAKMITRFEWECTLVDPMQPGETYTKVCHNNAEFENLLKVIIK